MPTPALATLDLTHFALTVLVGLLTFTLLGCALRRMRARHRMTVIVWMVSAAWSVGAGVWATWAMDLQAFAIPDGGQEAVLATFWLGSLAVLAALAVTWVNFLAHAQGPWPARVAASSVGFGLLWIGMLECARRAMGAPLPSAGAAWGPAGPVGAALLVCAGLAATLCLLGSQRLRTLTRPVVPLLAGATVMALANAAALQLALGRLHPADVFANALPGGTIDPPTLTLACAIAALAPVLGLICAWLDFFAHARNRELAASLNEANSRLREQAMTDPLTRMPNRLLFEERLEDALAVAGTESCALAVMFIDLDGFKPINDSFGHVAGDAVLREIGRRLQAVARPEDIVARVGGDEFLLMTVRPGHEAVASSIAQRVLTALGEAMTLPNQVTVNLSASIGIVLYPEHGPASKLIANADAAMYAAKRAGGSTYAFFEPRMELDARDQLALQNDLRHAIERNELQLYYQPKIDGRSGQVTGVESLLRWQHAVRGFVPPDRFIPIAERFGLIGTIGNWVINEACRQLREWTRMGLRMRISVNLSVHQLRQEDLVQRVRLAIAHHGVDPQLLTFEITESVAMEDTQETMKSFSQLASVGVSLSIDDFGTGYSSLSYLRKLPARQLKIDRSFVQDLGTSTDALAVVDAVIKLAHALDLRVVAEGVETPRQRDILLGLQCDELQGYLFAKPMAARMLTLWATGGGPHTAHGGHGTSVAQPDFRASLYMDDDPDAVNVLLQ